MIGIATEKQCKAETSNGLEKQGEEKQRNSKDRTGMAME